MAPLLTPPEVYLLVLYVCTAGCTYATIATLKHRRLIAAKCCDTIFLLSTFATHKLLHSCVLFPAVSNKSVILSKVATANGKHDVN